MNIYAKLRNISKELKNICRTFNIDYTACNELQMLYLMDEKLKHLASLLEDQEDYLKNVDRKIIRLAAYMDVDIDECFDELGSGKMALNATYALDILTEEAGS